MLFCQSAEHWLNILKKMKTLVIGGAGFIGSHLVEELVKLKFDVVVLDNLSTGNINNLKLVKKKISFIKQDIRINKNLKEILFDVDCIFHLAALSKVSESFQYPKKYYNNNVIGTKNILNSINKKKLKKIIFTASASCYGNPKKIPTSENAKIQTLSPYAYSKWISEKMIMKCANKNKFNAISLRLFNVYGSRSKASSSYSSVISIFLKRKKNRQKLTITGDGKQTRSFIHVKDVVNALIKSITLVKKNTIFNVGNSKSISINEIAKVFKSKKKYVAARYGEPKHSSANINKIKTKIGWKPKISIKKGIVQLIKNLS